MFPRKGKAGNEWLRNNPLHKGGFTFRSGDYLEWKRWIFISSMVFFLRLIAATPDTPRTHPRLLIPGLAMFSVDSPKWWIPQGNHCFAWKNFFLLNFFLNPRIPELFQLEKPSKTSKSKYSPELPSPPMSPNATPMCQMSFKAFIPSIGWSNFLRFFLQAICRLLNADIPMAQIFPVSFNVWKLGMEKWTQVWG